LVGAGHSVTVIAEFPNHPSGIIPPAYKGKITERVELDGIDVIRVWVKTSARKNTCSRLAFYLSYMIHATLAGAILAKRPYDAIYATSPPLFVGGAGLALSFLRRTPMVFEVRDLWPESAVALGELRSKQAISLAAKLEMACYRRARAIVVVTRGIMNGLLERDIPAEKLALIPNGANVDRFQFRPEGRARVRRTLGLERKFVAVYAGIHGVAQGLETVIEVAKQLRDDGEIQFLLVGEGPQKAEVMAVAGKYGLSNVSFVGEQPAELVPDYLSAADVAIIPLRNLELFKMAIPSKMFDAWACQRPVILSVDGEARTVLSEAGGGLFVPPEDVSAMGRAILDLKNDPLLREHMGRNGRLFTESRYSRQAQAAQLAHLLERTIPKGNEANGGQGQ
jgi:glycosyltransferase involved in cell wall biosynthesis